MKTKCFEIKYNYIYSKKTTVSEVANAKNETENQFWKNFQARNILSQPGWRTIAGGVMRKDRIEEVWNVAENLGSFAL